MEHIGLASRLDLKSLFRVDLDGVVSDVLRNLMPLVFDLKSKHIVSSIISLLDNKRGMELIWTLGVGCVRTSCIFYPVLFDDEESARVDFPTCLVATVWNGSLIVSLGCEVEVSTLGWDRDCVFLVGVLSVTILVVPGVLVALTLSLVTNQNLIQAGIWCLELCEWQSENSLFVSSGDVNAERDQRLVSCSPFGIVVLPSSKIVASRAPRVPSKENLVTTDLEG